MSKFKNAMGKALANVKKVGLMVGLGIVGYGAATHAAVDAELASTTATMTTTIKENLLGVLNANLPSIVIVGVSVLGIFFIWKLFRRFIGR